MLRVFAHVRYDIVRNVTNGRTLHSKKEMLSLHYIKTRKYDECA